MGKFVVSLHLMLVIGRSPKLENFTRILYALYCIYFIDGMKSPIPRFFHISHLT